MTNIKNVGHRENYVRLEKQNQAADCANLKGITTNKLYCTLTFKCF